jgi:hypothetical protein
MEARWAPVVEPAGARQGKSSRLPDPATESPTRRHDLPAHLGAWAGADVTRRARFIDPSVVNRAGYL